MSTELKDTVAAAYLQGGASAAILVSIKPRHAWDEKAKRMSESIDSYQIMVTSHANRYQTITVVVPADKFDLPIDDEELARRAQSYEPFPHISFIGLSIRFWTARDSNSIMTTGKASGVYMCDKNGKRI